MTATLKRYFRTLARVCRCHLYRNQEYRFGLGPVYEVSAYFFVDTSCSYQSSGLGNTGLIWDEVPGQLFPEQKDDAAKEPRSLTRLSRSCDPRWMQVSQWITDTKMCNRRASLYRFSYLIKLNIFS